MPNFSSLCIFACPFLASAVLVAKINLLLQCDTAIVISVAAVASSVTYIFLQINLRIFSLLNRYSVVSTGNVEEIVNTMEAAIDPSLSPAENAVQVLNLMLCQQETSQENKIRMLYCIEVLSKRTGEIFVPHGLLESSVCKTDCDEDCDNSVHEWLITQFSEVPHSQNSESQRSGCRSASSTEAICSSPSTRTDSGFSAGDWSSIVQNSPIRQCTVSMKSNSPSARRSSKIFGKGVLFDCSSLGKETDIETSEFLFTTSPDEKARILYALEGVDEWGWDVFKLSEAASGRELQVLGWHLLVHWDLIRKLGLKAPVVRQWLLYVESAYTLSEYHNATHATDVLQTVHFMLSSAGAAAYLNDVEIFAILIAAIIHDVGHDGFTNSYHKHLLTDRALSFNDQSIQENFHVWKIFSKMAAEQDLNIFQTLSSDQFVELRRLLIMMILSTDMSKHFALHNDFKLMLEAKGRDPSQWTASTDAFLCYLLHACDISAQSKPHDLAMAW